MYSLAHPCFVRKASQGKSISSSFSGISFRPRRLSGTAYRRSPGHRLKNALVLRSQAEGAGEVAYPRFSGELVGHRYYNPELGRWLNRDPIEEQGGMNIYSFAQNCPTDDYDILGRLCSLWSSKVYGTKYEENWLYGSPLATSWECCRVESTPWTRTRKCWPWIKKTTTICGHKVTYWTLGAPTIQTQSDVDRKRLKTLATYSSADYSKDEAWTKCLAEPVP